MPHPSMGDHALSRAVAAAPDLVDAATFHGVAGYVHRRIAGLPGIDSVLLGALQDGSMQAVATHLATLADLAGVRDAFDAHGIDWVVLKGPVLSELAHRAVHLRSYGDLDVLVAGTQLADAVRILEDRGAKTLDRNWRLLREEVKGELHLRLGFGTLLDLHWHLVNDRSMRKSFAVPVNDMIARRRLVEIGGGAVPALDREDTVLHLALHTALSGAHRLLWFKDVERTLAVEPPDWSTLVSRAHTAGVGLVTATVLDSTRALLRANVPPSVMRGLAPASVWRGLVRTTRHFAPPGGRADQGSLPRIISRSTRNGDGASFAELARRSYWHVSHIGQANPRDPTVLFNPTNPRSTMFEADNGDRGRFFHRVATLGSSPTVAEPLPPVPSSMRTVHVLALPATVSSDGNPYISSLYEGLQGHHITVSPVSRQAALMWDYDIIHYHWPEQAASPERVLAALDKTARMLFTVMVARFRRRRVLWTVHNLHSHEQRHPVLESVLMRTFTRLINGYILLSQSSAAAVSAAFPALRRVDGYVIEHGHYRDAYPPPPSPDVARAELGLSSAGTVILFAGLIRPYKNVPALISAFREHDDPTARLLIVGATESDVERERISEMASADARVVVDGRFVPKSEMATYMAAADLVVLPFREILNSGSALLALSFDRPIVVPACGALGELAERIGRDWVYTYNGHFHAGILAKALRWAAQRESDKAAPLDDLGWDVLSTRMARALRHLQAQPRGRRAGKLYRP